MTCGSTPLAVIGLLLVGGCDDASPARGAATASATATATAGATAAVPAVRAAITIDDAHDLLKKGAGYAIAPATELVLEVGDYRFATPDGAPGGPVDAVHVAHGSSEYYRASWSGGARITLDAKALDPVKGGAFSGFVAGETYLVAVGREEPSKDGVMRFAPAWTSTVAVTAR